MILVHQSRLPSHLDVSIGPVVTNVCMRSLQLLLQHKECKVSGAVAHSHVLFHHSSTCRVGQKKSHISAQGDADGSSPAIV